MIISYYAVFQYDDDGICISFPDIPSCLSCAYDKQGAEMMATEALELALHGVAVEQLPISSSKDSIHLSKNQRIKLITVDLDVTDGALFCSRVIDYD